MAPMILMARRQGAPPPPPASTFFRKPNKPTPAPTAAARSLVVNSDTPSAGGTGAEINPFKYLAEAEAVKQPGDHILLTGSAVHGNQGANDRIGMSSVSGTAGANIVYKRKPGSPQPVVQVGGGVNGWPTIHLVGASYHHFDDLDLRAVSGAGAWVTGLRGGANNNKFTRLRLDSVFFDCLNSSNNEWWELTWTGLLGSQSGNSGDAFNVSNGSNNCKVMKSSFDGIMGHGIGIVGNVQSGSTDVSGFEFFDNFCRNTWSGGASHAGHSKNPLVHWNRYRGMGRDANPNSYPRGSRDGMQLSCQNGTVAFNTVEDCWRGIMCSSYSFGGTPQIYSGNLLAFNAVAACQGVGLLIHHGPSTDPELYQINNTWENNILWDNHRTVDAADIAAGQDWYFNGAYNMIAIDHYASSSGGSGGGEWAIDSGNWHGNRIRNNFMGKASGATRAAIYVGSTSAPPQNNRYFTTAELASNNADNSGNQMLTSNPFVDLAGGDLHLAGGSQPINGGYPTSGVQFLGPAPDAGPYEYGGTD